LTSSISSLVWIWRTHNKYNTIQYVRLHKLSVSLDTHLKIPSHLCLGSELFINLPSLTFVQHPPFIYKKHFEAVFSVQLFPCPLLSICSESSSQKPSRSILGMKDQVSQPHKTTRTYIHSCIQNNSFNPMSDNPAVEQSSPKTISFAFYQKKDTSMKQTDLRDIFKKASKNVSAHQPLQ